MDSTELQRLVRDRRQMTRELHAPNDFYGHAATLKSYAGLPPHKSLKAVIEHGPALEPWIWDIDIRAPFPTFLCSGEVRAQLYEEARPGGRAVPIGPMIRYASNSPPPPRPRGRLLVFPAHSTHFVKSTYDASKFARTLGSYRDRFSEIAVCLYWKDAIDGAAAPYQAEGFECVTAGHMFDPSFLPRLRRLIDGADTVVSNRFGSYVPYAVALERPVWLHKQDVALVGTQKDLARDAMNPELFAKVTREIRRLFAEEVDDVTPEQRACLDPFTGFDHIRSPDELQTILAEAGERYLGVTAPHHRAWHYLLGRVARPIVERFR